MHLRIKANAGSSNMGEVGTAEVAFLCLFSRGLFFFGMLSLLNASNQCTYSYV